MTVKNSGGPKIDRQGQSTVTFGVSFIPDGSSNPSTSTIVGKRSFSTIVRDAVGTYTLTFPEAGAIRNAHCDVRVGSDTEVSARLGAFVQGSRTLIVYTYGPGNGNVTRKNLPLETAREIASSNIQALAAHGGILCLDSTPELRRVNAGTDIAYSLLYDASDSAEIQFPAIDMVADGVPDADLTINIDCVVSSTNDVPTFSVKTAFDIGDTVVTDTTTAASDTRAVVTATIAAADIPAAGIMNLAITPGAHTTDALTVYQVYLTWTAASALTDLTEDANTVVSVYADMYKSRDV